MSPCIINMLVVFYTWLIPKPNLSFVIGHVSYYMKTPHEIHWKAAKRILWYIQGTIQFGIHYSTWGKPLLVGFTNSDWAEDPDDQKSTAGYVFSLGSGPVTWACKKQQDLSLSLAKQNIEPQLMPVRKINGFGRSFQSLDSSSSSLLHFGATIKVPSSLPKI